MDELKKKRPYQMHFQEFDDNSGRAVFASRWKKEDFSDLQSFREFYSKFSSAIQALVQYNSMEEAENWFSPELYFDGFTTEECVHPAPHEIDATIWIESKLSFISIPWLHAFEHEKLYVYEGEEFPELIAIGKSGYLNMFVADAL